MVNACTPPASPPQQREVTLLFADLRGCTALTSSLATSPDADPLFCELLAQVLDCLTDAVVDHGGYVIDYYGDGLAAMWNAPADEPSHAERACRAGLQMLATLPGVSADWRQLTLSDLRLGVGIHTGAVLVGNAGSTRRVKYGARGPNVHLASRVESATKELRVPLLATQATAERLPATLVAHRVCRAQLPGLQLPVDLFAVDCSERSEPSSVESWQTYERALHLFEQGRFAEAGEVLAAIEAGRGCVPIEFLMERARRELGRGLRRRSTDKPATCPGGVITLAAKLA